MAKVDTQSSADWLIDGARSAASAPEVLAELCQRLVAAGIPLWRVAVFVQTLHPNVMGRRLTWRPGAEVEIGEASFEIFDQDSYKRSPVVRVYETGQAFRRHLADPACPRDFATIEELRVEGVTDYVIWPLIFTNGEIHAVSCTTRQEGGFTDAQIAGLDAIMKPLARVAESHALRRTAANLLDTYVGIHTGERILAGKIRRGYTERIRAVIWLSDMRGFTALSDRLPPADLVDLLNRYFDCQVPAIAEHGGEVLKFIGDGLLAIFPVADDESDAEWACNDVLVAARKARAEIAALNAATGGEARELRFGLALHLGEVLYGNIGGGNRLDFTCIGPAVNLAARIERLTSPLRRTILASDRFARYCQPPLVSLGEFTLAGFDAPQAAFGLADEGG
ncbi:MAG TPA: adenylate/guanylate cyclase domain-containing protein [Alphaproteobacteria bacterium]|nr:adenylate/guanylate cyclase domain-containing protein [Alphaproteobacteria bacterium]